MNSARNIGVIILIMSFAQHISAVSKSCFHNIRDPRRIRNTIDQTTAWTITISVKLLTIELFRLPAAQINRLQLVLNLAASVDTKTAKFHHITPILKYLI